MTEFDVYLCALGKAQSSREILDALVMAGGFFQERRFDFDPDRCYWSFYDCGVEFTFDKDVLLQVNIFVKESHGFNKYRGDLRIREDLSLMQEYGESEIIQLMGQPSFVRNARAGENIGGDRAIAYDQSWFRMMFEFDGKSRWSNLYFINRIG